MRIGLFDSGVGGLTVLERILETLRGGEILYVADTLRAPYGTKEFETLGGFAREILGFLVSKDVDLIVSACNTLDSVVKIGSISVPIPYMSIVESATEMVRTDRVAVLSTQFTARVGIYRSLLEGKEVFQRSAQLLVSTAEMGIRSGRMLDAILRNYTTPISRWKPSELILGCTHFSLYRKEIENLVESRIIDPAWNLSSKLRGKSPSSGFVVFYVTGDVEDFGRKLKRFGLHRKISYWIEKLDLKVLERGKTLIETYNGDIGIVGSG